MRSSKALFLLMALLLLAACGGGGGGDDSPTSTPPSISNLRFSPTWAALNSGTATVTGTVDFVDPQGDLSTVTMTTFDAAGQQLSTQTVAVQNVAGRTAGTISGTAQYATTAPGASSFQIFVTDASGLSSNALTGSFTVYVPSPSPPVGNNVLLVTVNGSLCSPSTSIGYINKPCVSVTVCTPGTSTCQTITDILLDSGDFGLRIFKQALGGLALTQETIGPNPVAECVQYGDGSSVWGPVQVASVVLGNEPAVQVPIHVVDSTFSTAPSGCQNAYQSPLDAGFNGILGVGFFAQDCGPICTSIAANGIYYTCSGPTCTGTAIPLSSQVQNPVSLLPVNNNGVIVQLPAVPPGGSSSVDGYLVLGIGTQSNNAVSSGVVAYPADPNIGEFLTNFGGTDYGSFIDTGSNGLFFPSTSIPSCTSVNRAWFCPESTTTVTALTMGVSGSPSGLVSFQIGNFDSLDASGNNVFPDVGANLPGAFDWGLPFHFGRNVYIGIEGRAASGLGTGPYWGYWAY